MDRVVRWKLLHVSRELVERWLRGRTSPALRFKTQIPGDLKIVGINRDWSKEDWDFIEVTLESSEFEEVILKPELMLPPYNIELEVIV